MSPVRPAGTEWVEDLTGVAHGAPLLADSRLHSAYQDASWYDRPNVHADKQAHVVVRSNHLHLAEIPRRRRRPHPVWAVVVVIAVALLSWIDKAKKHRFPDS